MYIENLPEVNTCALNIYVYILLLLGYETISMTGREIKLLTLMSIIVFFKTKKIINIKVY